MNGCQPSCDNLPTESLATVRIVNAITNAPQLLIYIDGKFFDSAVYDVNQNSFGYRTTYKSDGSQLRSGVHHVVALDNATHDSVVTWNGPLYDHRQTLVIFGRENSGTAEAPRTLYLDDVDRAPDVKYSLVRFVDVIPDLSGVDVYFADSLKAAPDLHLTFGTISDAQGGNAGTGLSPNDYVQIPLNSKGILVLPAGDRDTNDQIFSEPYPFASQNFLSTIVMQGAYHPTGSEPTISLLVLADGEIEKIPFIFWLQTFGIRMVNATPLDSITLLVASANDQNLGVPRSIGYAPFSGQQNVTDVLKDSVSPYMGFSTSAAWFDFWFGPDTKPADTLFRFTTNSSGFGYKIPPIQPNDRWTFIAIDTIAHNTGPSGMSVFELLDTVSAPPDPSIGRVRFVNTSADYTATFTFHGKSFTLAQRGVGYADAPVGHYSVPVSGGGASGTLTFNVASGTITIFLLPEQGSTIPYTVQTP